MVVSEVHTIKPGIRRIIMNIKYLKLFENVNFQTVSNYDGKLVCNEAIS